MTEEKSNDSFDSGEPLTKHFMPNTAHEEKSKTSFNLSEWRSKGKDAYNELSNREARLEADLEEVRKDKIELGKILGKDEQTKEPTKRSRIRPAIIAYVVQNNGDISVDNLCKRLVEMNPRFKEKSVKISLERLAKDSEEVSITDNIVHYTPKKSA